MVQPQKKYTPEEYLALEETAPYKSEYYDGYIYPMGDFEGDTPLDKSGNRPAHNTIRENLSGELGSFFKKNKKCRSFSSDQRVLVAQNGLYTYPDVVVVCGKPEFEKDSLTNPVLIIEVLSKSTAHYDRSEKFELYRGISTFKEYLLIDSQRVYVELHQKNEDGFWVLTAELRSLEKQVALQSVGITLTLSDIYSNTEDLMDVIFQIR